MRNTFTKDEILNKSNMDLQVNIDFEAASDNSFNKAIIEVDETGYELFYYPHETQPHFVCEVSEVDTDKTETITSEIDKDNDDSYNHNYAQEACLDKLRAILKS